MAQIRGRVDFKKLLPEIWLFITMPWQDDAMDQDGLSGLSLNMFDSTNNGIALSERLGRQDAT